VFASPPKANKLFRQLVSQRRVISSLHLAREL